MTIAIDYLLLLGFCFGLASGLFLGLNTVEFFSIIESKF